MTDILQSRAPPPQPKNRLSRREPAAKQILEMLRERIVKGDLAPGARIVERTVCAEMNVSRTPLREALKLLAIDGLVQISQHKGATVMPFTPEEALQLFEVLSGLEGLAAELAVSRIANATLADLRAKHDQMRTHFDRGEKDAYFELNSAIHTAIVEAAGNPILASTHHALLLRAKRGRYMAIVDPHRWREAFDEHEAVMDAFAKKDAKRAGEVWRTHLIHTGETVADVLRAAMPD
ncbi:MAG: GntR family transcriptional regulator [Roseibium sp.]|nr:GntR family transcriptional regulator [Roseibium sp.]